jgi:acyl-CoA thioester hydrolase
MSSSDHGASAAPLLDTTLDVRWRDLDAFNHVNNSTYLTYLEESRLRWLQQIPDPWYDEHALPVMVSSEVNYRQPVTWPAVVRIQLFCEKLGNSSMTVGHRILDAHDESRLYSDGRVVVVWMDPATGKSVPLPAAIRAAASARTDG